MDDLFVEVPGNWLSDQAQSLAVGPFTLNVICKEHILAERIVGFRWWKYAGHAVQAVNLLLTGGELDEALVRSALRREGAEDTYDLLIRYAHSGGEATWDALDARWQEHYGNANR